MRNSNCELLVKRNLRTKNNSKENENNQFLIYSQIGEKTHTNPNLVQIMRNPNSFQKPKANACMDLDRSGPSTTNPLTQKCSVVKYKKETNKKNAFPHSLYDMGSISSL